MPLTVWGPIPRCSIKRGSLDDNRPTVTRFASVSGSIPESGSNLWANGENYKHAGMSPVLSKLLYLM